MRLDNHVPGPAAGHLKILTKRPKPLSGVRVLIVEDELLQALELEDIIVTLGGAVPAIACSFERAMQALEGVEFDCALLDVNLSGNLSFSIAARLQQRGIPVIFCTAYADAAKVFGEKRAVAYLDKPIEKAALGDTLISLLKLAAQNPSTQETG